MRRTFLIILAAAVPFGSLASASDVSPVVQRDEIVGGRSLVDWDVAWSKWIFGFRRSSLPQRGGCLPQSGSTPVRFLFTPLLEDSHLTTINCTVPAGTYLLLGQPQVYCTNVRPDRRYPTTASGLARCARDFWNQVTDPHPRVAIDGQPIPNGAVVRTHAFSIKMPARDNLFDMPGVRHGRAASVARATMIRPLAPGKHTLTQGVRYRGSPNRVGIFQLTVTQ